MAARPSETETIIDPVPTVRPAVADTALQYESLVKSTQNDLAKIALGHLTHFSHLQIEKVGDNL